MYTVHFHVQKPFALKENWVTHICMRVLKYENTMLLLPARSITLLENTNADQPIKKIPVLYKRKCFITAFTWGHRIIMCTCVTGCRLPPGFVRVFVLLPCYAAYVLFVYRRFGTNNLPTLQGAKCQLSSPVLRMKYILAFKDGTDRLSRNFGNQRPNFAA
jgi:hypothetical protein